MKAEDKLKPKMSAQDTIAALDNTDHHHLANNDSSSSNYEKDMDTTPFTLYSDGSSIALIQNPMVEGRRELAPYINGVGAAFFLKQDQHLPN